MHNQCLLETLHFESSLLAQKNEEIGANKGLHSLSTSRKMCMSPTDPIDTVMQRRELTGDIVQRTGQPCCGNW
jgi:hypothetical protein